MTKQDDDPCEQRITAMFTAQTETLDTVYRMKNAEIDELKAALATSCKEREQLQKENAILKLAVPLEEELAGQIDEMLKYLAMEQGYTLNGIARLLVRIQQRMAADWTEIGRERLLTRQACKERDEAKAQAEMLRASEPLAHARLREERDTLSQQLDEAKAETARYDAMRDGYMAHRNAQHDALSQQLTTLREALKEVAERWKTACEHETKDEPSAWACASELSALLSDGGQ